MIKKTIIAIIFLIFLFWMLHQLGIVQAEQSTAKVMPAQTIQCPSGSYEIGAPGEGICKAQPTGCPFGEQIPIDSPKCVAPSPEVWEPWDNGTSQNIDIGVK